MSMRELNRIAREVRRRDRQIRRLTDLQKAAQESTDAYLLAISRIQLLSTELDRAEKRSDGERVVEIAREIKLAHAEKLARQKAEIKLNASLSRLLAKLSADREAWESRTAKDGAVNV